MSNSYRSTLYPRTFLMMVYRQISFPMVLQSCLLKYSVSNSPLPPSYPKPNPTSPLPPLLPQLQNFPSSLFPFRSPTQSPNSSLHAPRLRRQAPRKPTPRDPRRHAVRHEVNVRRDGARRGAGVRDAQVRGDGEGLEDGARAGAVAVEGGGGDRGRGGVFCGWRGEGFLGEGWGVGVQGF